MRYGGGTCDNVFIDLAVIYTDCTSLHGIIYEISIALATHMIPWHAYLVYTQEMCLYRGIAT